MADDLFDPRLTEQSNPRTRDIDGASPLEIVDLINAEDRSVPEAVGSQREAIAHAIEIAVDCFQLGGRLIYVGAGTSGRLGVLDATECPPTFGTPPEMVQGIIAGGHVALVRSQEGAEDRADDGASAMDDATVGPNDFVFGIATSSTTPYVRGALERAAKLGAKTGFLCCTEPGDEYRALVDVCVVPLVGPEAVTGSTRMKAGTATKLVLNTITTGAMIRLGKTYGNLMVDLQTMSEKLVDRSERIVMAVAGCPRDEALRLLYDAGGSVKVAITMARAGVNREMAELYLAESGGFVRTALDLAERVDRDSQDTNPFAPYPIGPPNAYSIELVRSAIGNLVERIADSISTVPDDRLSRRPTSDRWCVKEHVQHLADCDEYMRQRIVTLLVAVEPALVSRDDAVENAKTFESGAREARAESLLEGLSQSRAHLLSELGVVNSGDLERKGKHEVFGSISVYQILRHLIWHDHRHLEAIKRLLSD